MTQSQNDNNDLQFIGYENVSEHTHHHKHHHSKKHSKRHKVKKILLIILCSVLALLIAAAATVFILIRTGKAKMINQYAKINIPKEVTVAAEDGGKTITYKGSKYVFNKDITSILCMGIDRESFNTDTNSWGANGQSDANLLMTIDTKTGKTTVININRDTIVDIKSYSSSGSYLGSEKKQLCLAYANGDGKEKSCENTVEAVSSIFYGIPINSYYAIDLDALGPLNSAVGSITVTPNTTFSYKGITYTKGQKTVLDTKQKVMGYVRYRDISDLESNLDRMKRQQEFLKAFSSAAISKTKSNLTFPVSLYNTAKGYNVNNIDVSKVSYLASVIMSKGAGKNMEFLSVPGKVAKGEKNAEFTPDNDKLFELILKVFYRKVQ